MFVLEALSQWATSQADKVVWSFLDDKGVVNDAFTYQQLENATTALAIHLQQTHSLKLGDRVLLVFFPGLSFTASLLACFKIGVIAVPVFPPDPRRLKKDLHHFISIQQSSGAKVALTHSPYNFLKKIQELKGIFSTGSVVWPELKWIQVDDSLSKGKIGKGITSNYQFPKISESDVAFLQYTSGSTSEPKGVMISHRNLSHNLQLIITSLKADMNTVNVSWLPQYHDMGLIGSYLGLLYCGGRGYYLSPISFLKDPTLWIRSISAFRGTHTQAPNFAFALIVRKFKEWLQHNQSVSLDLSCVQHMINAAEPVDGSVVINFHEMFSQYGLKPDVLKPTYGLAEHTVFVCSDGNQILTITKDSLEQGKIQILSESTITELAISKHHIKPSDVNSTSHDIVGCGYPDRGDGVYVVIVDPESKSVLPPRQVGEIWVESSSKAQGYWGLPDLTKEDFQATLSADSAIDSRKFLRTGDLGFYHNDELFICGRIKDLIIVRGSNHYPQDIERTAEHASSNIRPGCSAAFAIKREQDDTEAVIYVAEIKENVKPSEYASISEACRLAVAKEHGIVFSSICLIVTRTISKTTSGKIARSWCKREYLAGKLNLVHRWDASSSDMAAGIENIENVDEEGLNEVDLKDGGTEQDGLMEGMSSLTEEEVRNMPRDQLLNRLETLLVQVASSGPSPISSPIEKDSSLTSLGLDSLTLVQFKGALEHKFHCHDIPDEFLFTNICTLNGLADAAQIGSLTAEQKELLEIAGKDSGENQAVVVDHKEHLCPWFIWCC